MTRLHDYPGGDLHCLLLFAEKRPDRFRPVVVGVGSHLASRLKVRKGLILLAGNFDGTWQGFRSLSFRELRKDGNYLLQDLDRFFFNDPAFAQPFSSGSIQ
jgi:hypothetical protein